MEKVPTTSDSPDSRVTIGWAGSVLILTAVVAICAKIVGVVVAPGARGEAGESTVNFLDMLSGAFAYTLTALLVALVCGASFELARTRVINIIARGSVVAVSGLIVALASPAVVERLSTVPSLALAVITSIIALVAGVSIVRTPQTRAIGAVLALLAICGLLRVVAWETSAVAFDRMSKPIHDVARGFATAAVAVQAFAALVAAAWVGTRSKWRGRVLANAAILLAFGLTWLAARTTESPSMFEAILRRSLPAGAGLPPPYYLGSIGAFLVPASILLAAVALLQCARGRGAAGSPRAQMRGERGWRAAGSPRAQMRGGEHGERAGEPASATERGEAPAIVAPLALALLSHGAFDVPLHALLITASAQWAMLAMTEDHSFPVSLALDRDGLPRRAAATNSPSS